MEVCLQLMLSMYLCCPGFLMVYFRSNQVLQYHLLYLME
nr:MAG TPA: hypothetical protein [Caudoviricetes sp.]